ncbi:MAG: hypothetical protein ACR2HV_10310 [Acidimicrobiales bacterium]
MIVLLIILVVAAIGGMAAYVIMQYSGFGGTASPSQGTSVPYLSGRGTRSSGPLSERIADAPQGCLIAVMAAVGIWVTLWAVLLVLGLRVLTA